MQSTVIQSPVIKSASIQHASIQNLTMQPGTSQAAEDVVSYMEELSWTIPRLPISSMDQIAALFLAAYDRGRTIFLFGNGGSASLASHMTCDLGKGTIAGNGKRLRAVALTDNVALITAWANDAHYEDIFTEQLQNLLHPGDVAFAISASGNSPNVLSALAFARRSGAATAGITGFQGGQMKSLCDICVVVPSDNMQIIEDLHLSISHAIFRVVRHGMLDKPNRTVSV
ncbi:MAG: SIS domain-containing protein [Candidatus Sulfotelmatobacter sp.]